MAEPLTDDEKIKIIRGAGHLVSQQDAKWTINADTGIECQVGDYIVHGRDNIKRSGVFNIKVMNLKRDILFDIDASGANGMSYEPISPDSELGAALVDFGQRYTLGHVDNQLAEQRTLADKLEAAAAESEKAGRLRRRLLEI